MNAIVLLSGGIDSAVCAAMAKNEGYQVYALSFDYGQKHKAELIQAQRLAQSMGIHHTILKLPALSPMKGNYFPARNTIFLAYALAHAELMEADTIFLGNNADDTFFPDCLPEYVEAFQKLAKKATKLHNIWLATPLIDMHKQDIIARGIKLGVDFSMTMSCYEGNNCGNCASCKLRAKGFQLLNQLDPIS